MNIKNFDDAFDLLIGNEGGFSIVASDPGNWTGGKVGSGDLIGTMWGVSAPVAREEGWTGRMQDLPRDRAKQIAKKRYWDPLQLDQIDPEIAFQVFDAAYNGGPAAHWLQTAAGATADGNIGAKTIAAVRSTNKHVVIMRFDAYRLQYLAKNPHLEFKNGWMNRIANNLLEGADQ